MPRRGGYSRSPSPRRSASYSQGPMRSSPRPTMAPPQQQRGGMFGGLGSMLATGMAFGAGSEIAHQAVRGVTGGGGHGQVAQQGGQQLAPTEMENMSQPVNKCQGISDQFIDCLKANPDAIQNCQHHFDWLKDCEKKAYS